LAVWRNSIDDVSSFLNTKHAGKYYVYNLTENQYDTAKFEGRVHWMGWMDHNAPPIQLLYEIMLSMDDWLKADPLNIAVIHCKAGKGRTGTVIASYLVYSGQTDTAQEALQMFAKQRFSTATSLGVEIPSQARAVYYMQMLLKGVVQVDRVFTPRRLRLKRVLMHPVPQFGVSSKGCHPVVEIFQDAQRPGIPPLFTTTYTDKFTANDLYMLIDFDLEIAGDILIKVYNQSTLFGKQFMFRTFFHTSFIEGDQYFFDLPLSRLDGPETGALASDPAFSSDFKLRLLFSDPKSK